MWNLNVTSNWTANGQGVFKVKVADGYKPTNNLEKGCLKDENSYWNCTTSEWNTLSGEIKYGFDFQETNCPKITLPNCNIRGPSGVTTGKSYTWQIEASSQSLKNSGVYIRKKVNNQASTAGWTTIAWKGNETSYTTTNYTIPSAGTYEIVCSAVDTNGKKCSGNPQGDTPRCTGRDYLEISATAASRLDKKVDSVGDDPDNLITNPDFTNNTSGWSFYTNGEGGFSNNLKSALIGISKPGSNVVLSQTGISLKPNTKYTFSFRGKANRSVTVPVYLHDNNAPYTNYGLKTSANLTTNWKTFTKVFTTPSGVSKNARLRFWFALNDQANDKYFIDDVSLTED